MNATNKILTVAYGTFSCTLEGFDDPLAAMREVVAHFQEVADRDRSFGAEPAKPVAAEPQTEWKPADVAEEDVVSRVLRAENADESPPSDWENGIHEPDEDAGFDHALAVGEPDDERPVPSDESEGAADAADEPAADDPVATILRTHCTGMERDEAEGICDAKPEDRGGCDPAASDDPADQAPGPDALDDVTAFLGPLAEGSDVDEDAELDPLHLDPDGAEDDGDIAFLDGGDDAQDAVQGGGVDAEPDAVATEPEGDPAAEPDPRQAEATDERVAARDPFEGPRQRLRSGEVAARADVERLFAVTDSRMAGGDTSRAHDTIFRLRDAVAARRAEAPRADAADRDADAFRSDLARTIRPRRTRAEAEGSRTPRPAAEDVPDTPLMLVADHRVTADVAAPEATPGGIRPRRVRRATEADDAEMEMLANVGAWAGGRR